jgi:hypothetical protein
VLKWSATSFAVPLDGLNVRVVLAPIELGPYNRHAGYQYGEGESGTFILGNPGLAGASCDAAIGEANRTFPRKWVKAEPDALKLAWLSAPQSLRDG